MHFKPKVLLVQTMNMNLGDSVLSDNDAFLLRKAFRPFKGEIFPYSISSRDIEQLRYVDAMIFAGGIIKASNEKFWLYIPELLKEANRLGVPVFFSAIGVEPFQPENEKSVALKEALNLPCVKAISVRDDVETLRRSYITNPNIRISSVTDPAVWCTDTYREALRAAKETREPDPKRRPIGVGIVRDKLFSDYGNPQIDRAFQIKFWTGVIEELERRGLPWQIFTNGDRYDELFAEEILRLVGHGEKLPAPRDADELVANISRFRGVIAGRMHSNIVAYALSVPSVGFIWNRKLRFWSEKIGHPERFFEVGSMEPKAMLDVLEQALDKNEPVPKRLKMPVYRAMKDFVRRWCKPGREQNVPWADYMVAVGLGGIEKRYPRTNSAEAMDSSLRGGFRKLQVDLRLTADGSPVCVERWDKNSYKKLNLEPAEPELFPPLPLKDFLNAKYFHRFATMTFAQFLSKLQLAGRDAVDLVIVSVGRPAEEDLSQMLDAIEQAVASGALQKEKFLLRVERKTDVDAVRARGTELPLMLHLSPGKADWLESVGQDLEYIKQEGISWLSMNIDNFSHPVSVLLREHPVKVCLFTAVKASRLTDAVERGADLVGSQYLDVDYMTRLTARR